jgi:hypothetical protein
MKKILLAGILMVGGALMASADKIYVSFDDDRPRWRRHEGRWICNDRGYCYRSSHPRDYYRPRYYYRGGYWRHGVWVPRERIYIRVR